MESNRFAIQKLNNQNYSTWKFNVELLLVREGLWRCVDPGTKKEAEDQATFDALDAKARATICLLVEEKQHPLVRPTKSAAAAWKALEDHHEQKTMDIQVSLYRQVVDKRLQEGESMEEHLYVMGELFEKLRVAGTDLAEKLRIIMVTRSLPSSWGAYTSTLEMRKDLTVELVKRKLLDEAAKRQGSASEEAALSVGAARGRGGGGGKQKKPLVCFQCEKEGHKMADCDDDDDDSQPQPSGSGARPARRSVQKKKEESVSFAMSACALSSYDSSSEEKVWVVDSGASSHTISDRSFFSELKGSEMTAVHLADGRLAKVEGQGSGVIECCDEDGHPRKMNISSALYTPDLTMNLLSVPELIRKGASVVYDVGGCRILRGETTVAVADLKDGVYQLRPAGAVPEKVHHRVRKPEETGCQEEIVEYVSVLNVSVPEPVQQEEETVNPCDGGLKDEHFEQEADLDVPERHPERDHHDSGESVKDVAGLLKQPRSHQEAAQCPVKAAGLESIKEEMQSVNNTSLGNFGSMSVPIDPGIVQQKEERAALSDNPHHSLAQHLSNVSVKARPDTIGISPPYGEPSNPIDRGRKEVYAGDKRNRMRNSGFINESGGGTVSLAKPLSSIAKYERSGRPPSSNELPVDPGELKHKRNLEEHWTSAGVK